MIKINKSEMNSLHPYLHRLLRQFQTLTQTQYFEPVTAILVVLIFFVIGRKSYESKFTHVLNTINDCENEKKRLTHQLKSKQDSLRNLDKKLIYFKGATAFIVCSVAAYIYIKKFNSFVVMVTIMALVLLWSGILLIRKYLKVMIKRTQVSLQKKLISSEADAKQIIALLGDDVCKQLKVKFQRQLDMQWRNDQLKECDLRKCHEEKTIYKDLIQLYKDIIGEMQRMQWCDICSQKLNVDANEIKLAEVEKRLKNYSQVGQKLSLERKKELTNKLLEEWQMLEGKLPYMCRRGCCIKFRNSLDEIKKVYHDKLKNLKGRLTYVRG